MPFSLLLGRDFLNTFSIRLYVKNELICANKQITHELENEFPFISVNDSDSKRKSSESAPILSNASVIPELREVFNIEISENDNDEIDINPQIPSAWSNNFRLMIKTLMYKNKLKNFRILITKLRFYLRQTLRPSVHQDVYRLRRKLKLIES